MSIVLDEYKWAEKVLQEHQLGRKPYETLTRVAKYYTYRKLKKKELRKALEAFLLSCDPTASLVLWSDMLDHAMKAASKYPIIMLDGIDITEKEMAVVDGIDGRQLKRLAFTLLCVAKYSHAIYEKNEYWVNTPDNEVMAMANINTSIKRQSQMFSQLRDLGLIKFSKRVDNLSVQVLFVDEDGGSVLHISDFRNLGYQYLKYHGEPFFVCTECGITEKVKDPAYLSRKKYCDDCAAKIHIKQKVDSVMRIRERKQNSNC